MTALLEQNVTADRMRGEALARIARNQMFSQILQHGNAEAKQRALDTITATVELEAEVEILRLKNEKKRLLESDQ
jgi:hypothetical protein